MMMSSMTCSRNGAVLLPIADSLFRSDQPQGASRGYHWQERCRSLRCSDLFTTAKHCFSPAKLACGGYECALRGQIAARHCGIQTRRENCRHLERRRPNSRSTRSRAPSCSCEGSLNVTRSRVVSCPASSSPSRKLAKC
jgi:hypothetical protein